MRALAAPGAAKVEAQDRESETVQSLGGLKDDFVVQRAAVERMRMTHDGRERRFLLPRTPQHCFKPPRRPCEEEAAMKHSRHRELGCGKGLNQSEVH